MLKSFGLLHLGDLPILAEPALEIAANGGYGKGARTREKVVEGLLFNGVDGLRNGLSVGMGIKGASAIFPDPTDPELSIRNLATVVAKET